MPPIERGMSMRRRQFIAGVAGSVAFPLAGRALPANVPVVGVLSFNSAGPMMASRIDGFLRGLSELHYVADQNVAIEYRWAEFHGDRLPALADDLVRRQVAVIATFTRFTALAAKAATATIPIVFSVGDDPVKVGLVASLNRPGGNVTGVSQFNNVLGPKRIGLLHELVPNAVTIGMIENPSAPEAESHLREAQEAAGAIGLKLHVQYASSERELDAAFATLVQQRIGALLIGADPLFRYRREQLVALAARHAVPAMYPLRDFVA